MTSYESQERAVSFAGQIYPEDTVAYFRIASDTGRHPIEPVGVGEFRIGSGGNCHLRFDDATIADLHVVLQVDRDVVLLKTTSSQISVFVNGSAESECRLTDGDLLEIGSHRLLFRLVAAQNRITLDEESFTVTTTSAKDSGGLENLVDRLGEQIELVEELSHSEADGVSDLLSAVSRAAVRSENENPGEASALHQVRSLIQQHHAASRIRLESLTEVLDNVVQQQKMIADTLAVMWDRIQAMNADQAVSPRRQSA